MPFQTVVNQQPAPALSGDFASANVRTSMLAGPGALVVPPPPGSIAAALGFIVGHFFSRNPNTQALIQGAVAGNEIAFLSRRQQGLITSYLQDSTYVVPPGFPIVGHTEGDFWVKIGSAAIPGQQVYADATTGKAVLSATSSGTASAGFTGTASFAGSQMTLASITGNTIVSIGDVVNATGVPAGTTVTGLVSGTANTVGAVYSLSGPATTEAAEATTTTSSVLNVTAVAAGAFDAFDPITGTGVTAGTSITGYNNAASVGGVGQYTLSTPQNFASTTVTVTGAAIATKFYTRSACNAGELVKISTW